MSKLSRLLLILVLALAAQGGKRALATSTMVLDKPLTILQAYPIAKAYALKWRSNSYLDGAYAIFSGPLPSPESMTFGFVADRRIGPFRWWDRAFVHIDALSGDISGVSTYLHQTHPRRARPFDLSSVVVDSSDAIRIAEALGGQEYRAKFPGSKMRIAIIHGQYGTEQLLWHIEHYRSSERPAGEIRLYVDASTGEVSD